MENKKWIEMDGPAKLEVFEKIFILAATEMSVRERLLASESSAIAAFAEKGNVEVPADFSILFIDQHDSEEKTNRVILKLHAFEGEGANVNPEQHWADEAHVLCTYPWWKQRKKY